MQPTHARTLVAASIALAAVAFVASACSSSSDAPKAAELASGCSINSECAEPLVCAYRKCHTACAVSRDCPSGERCVASDRPFHVCQLPAEAVCKFNSDCPTGQICAIDGQCRDQCKTDRDCVSEQTCSSGVCADSHELVDGGLANDAGVEAAVGFSCRYDSECSGTLVCRDGLCGPECLASRDCAGAKVCAAGRCVTPGPDGGPFPCGADACVAAGASCGKVLDGCDAQQTCGTCADGESCSGASGRNTCIAGLCEPVDCASRRLDCGYASDGCGGLVDCGTCTGGEVCGASAANVCGPVTARASCTGAGAAAAQSCGAGTEDCCASELMPSETFARDDDARFSATLSPVRLDRYLVTVGRFRAFVEAGGGTQAAPPTAGAGAHPKVPSSGWADAYVAKLAADTAALEGALLCNEVGATWSASAGALEANPINCVTWYEALAFCAWDGGWLASEAEISMATVGGKEQRSAPWGELGDAGPNGEPAFDGTYVNYWSSGNGNAPTPVGAKSPTGDGRFGHADLFGNVRAWAADSWADPMGATTCDDCVFLTTSAERVTRGCSFYDYATDCTVSKRRGESADRRDTTIGFRCARAR